MEISAKYSCIIIDDEPIALRVINGYVDKIGNFEVLGCFSNALEALNILHSNKIDLIFLDIEMPGINGLEFLKSIPQPPKVIFTTAYRNYAAEAFDVDALDYLVKPIPFERFLKAVNKFYETVKQITTETPTSEQKHIVLKSDKKNYKVDVNDILYIESLDDYIKVHTKQNTLVCYLRLSGIETMLDSAQFIRIHRAYIVNVKQVKVFTHAFVEIDKKQIPIGRNYRDEVVKKLGDLG
ncbi:MAG: response regulator transcription factor [Bacteroidales bacterium]|nr:response regulator transcription factor [Bacteroidales bacterium]HPD95045.1 LytTR family DNA-binding domain-containing protein [Tenuifilaceae bacterium]HRX32362.1 LytTR family DNA-binding domain-containing protein [Tenuifilaceae bacterium]